jgi:hypothetical protein
MELKLLSMNPAKSRKFLHLQQALEEAGWLYYKKLILPQTPK